MKHAISFFYCTVPVEFLPVEESISVNELQNVKLSCVAIGRPTPEVSWMFNGIRINGNLLFI